MQKWQLFYLRHPVTILVTAFTMRIVDLLNAQVFHALLCDSLWRVVSNLLTFLITACRNYSYQKAKIFKLLFYSFQCLYFWFYCFYPTRLNLQRYFSNMVKSLCHSYRLSPSNQASHIIFDSPISLKWREEMFSVISKNILHLQEREWEWELSHTLISLA